MTLSVCLSCWNIFWRWITYKRFPEFLVANKSRFQHKPILCAYILYTKINLLRLKVINLLRLLAVKLFSNSFFSNDLKLATSEQTKCSSTEILLFLCSTCWDVPSINSGILDINGHSDLYAAIVSKSESKWCFSKRSTLNEAYIIAPIRS